MKPSSFLVSVAFSLLALPGIAAGGVVLDYTASKDATPANNVWEDLQGNTTHDWNLNGAPHVAVGASEFFISHAYQFDGFTVATTNTFETIGGTNYSQLPASFELLFKADAFGGKQLIFESGGGTDGMAIYVDTTTLHVEAKDGGNRANTFWDLTGLTVEEQGDFIHMVGTLDPGADTADLYVNGVHRHADSPPGGWNDWCGTNNTGLAGINGAIFDSGSFVNYAGQVSVLRLYDTALTAGEVQDLFILAQTAVYTWDGTLIGNWGTDHWNAPGGEPLWPNADIGAVIDTDSAVVTVEADHAAKFLQLKQGELVIGFGNTLDVGGTVEGTAIALQNNAQLIAGGGGSIEEASIMGNATIDTGGPMTAVLVDDGATAGAFTKKGPATLSVNADDSDLGVTTVQVEAGILEMKSTGDPLAGAAGWVLKGGTIAFDALPSMSMKNDTLAEWWFAGTYGDQHVGHNNDVDDPPSLLTQSPHVARGLNVDVDFEGEIMSDRGQYIFDNSLNNANDPHRIGLMLHGTMHVEIGTPVEPGDFLFFALESDDLSTAWFDIDKDDDLELALFPNPSEEVATDTSAAGWQINNITNSIIPTVEGDHRVAFGFQEGTGAEYLRIKWWAGTEAELPVVDPLGVDKDTFIADHMHWLDPGDPAQAGIWKGLAPDPFFLDMTLTVAEPGSGLHVVGMVQAEPATLKEAVMQDGAGLATSMSGPFYTSIVVNKTILPAGTDPGAVENLSVAFNPEIPTLLTGNEGLVYIPQANDAGLAPDTMTVVVGGTSDVIADKAPAAGDLANVIVKPTSGRFINQLGSSSIPGATVDLSGGAYAARGAEGTVENALKHEAFLFRGRARLEGNRLALDHGGSVLNAPAVGTSLYAGAIALNGDAQWRAAFPYITRDNDYQSLFTGVLHTEGSEFDPPIDYDFEIQGWSDDRVAIWVDLDQDGLFQRSNSFAQDEQLIWDVNNTPVTVSLDADSDYKVALLHAEFGGGSTMRVRINSPGLGGLQQIDPSAAAQAGMWSAPGRVGFTDTTPITVLKNSTLEAITDQVGAFDDVTLKNGILTTTVANPLGSIVINQLKIHPDTEGDVGVRTLTDTLLTGTHPIQGPGDLIPATFEKRGPATARMDKAPAGTGGLGGTEFSVIEGRLLLKMAPGNPVADAPVVLRGGTLALEGADQVFPGLLLGTVGGNIDTGTPNPGNWGFDPLGPSASEMDCNPDNDPVGSLPWARNTTLIYTGEMKMPGSGVASFYENIDDKVRLWLAGQLVLTNGSWNTPTSGTITRDANQWYPFELRMSNGTGFAGAHADPTLGFGYSPTDTFGSTDPADYVHPQNSDPNTADMFRFQGFAEFVFNSVVTVDGRVTDGLKELWFLNPTPAEDWAERDGVSGSGDRSSPILDLIDQPNAEPAAAAAHLRDGLLSGTLTPVNETVLDTYFYFVGGRESIMRGKAGRGDDYAAVWLGTMEIGGDSPLQTGWVTLGLGSDDGTVFWIDLDGDGAFEHADPGAGQPEELIVDNNWYQGHTLKMGDVEITNPGRYNIAIGFFEGGGADTAEARFGQGQAADFGGVSDLTIIDPMDPNQYGIWAPPAGTYKDSTIELLSHTQATLNQLVLKNGEVHVTGVAQSFIVNSATVSAQTEGTTGVIADQVETLLTGTSGINGAGAGAAISLGGSAGIILDKDGTALAGSELKIVPGMVTARVPTGNSASGTPGDDPIEDAALVFAGGTFRIETPTDSVQGASVGPLTEYWFDGLTVTPQMFVGQPGAASDEYLGIDDTADATYTPANITEEPGLGWQVAQAQYDSTFTLNGPLSYPNDGDGSAKGNSDPVQTPGQQVVGYGVDGSGQNYYMGYWTGTLTQPAGLPTNDVMVGTWSDDGSVWWLDLDQDGEFERDNSGGPIDGGGADELVVDNSGTHGTQNRTNTLTLAPGDYGIALGFYEQGGGDAMQARIGIPYTAPWTPLAWGDMDLLDPTAPPQTSFYPLGIDWTGEKTIVRGGGVLDAPTVLDVKLGEVIWEEGILTMQGAWQGFLISQPIIAASDTTVGINAQAPVTITGIVGTGSSNVVYEKWGTLPVVVKEEGTDLGGVSFAAMEGQLIFESASPSPVPGATFQVGGAGEIILTAKDLASPPDPYMADYTSNAVNVVADGVLTAGSGGIGEADVPVTVNLGTAGVKDFTLTDGTVTLRTTDDYLLDVQGTMSGGGGFAVSDPDTVVAITGGGSAGGGTVSDGTVTLGADLGVGVMRVTGGVTDTAGNNLVVSSRLQIGDVHYQISNGDTFNARSSNLATQALLELDTVDSVLSIGPLTRPADFVAYWPLDEAAGATTAVDASPNGHDGTIFGATVEQPGVVGTAYEFDGTDDYVNIDAYKGITGANSRSMSAWVKTTQNNEMVLSWGSNNAGRKWVFRVQDGNGQAGAIRVEVNGGYMVGTTDLRDDEWHHVSAVLPDGATNVTEVLLYVDGQPNGSSASQTQAINTASGADVKIGNDHQDRWYDGLIDEVYIYDRALDDDEIQALWQFGVAGGAAPEAVEAETTDLLVKANVKVTSPADEVALGSLTIQGATALNLDNAFFVFGGDVTADDGASIVGDFAVGGVLSVGGSVGSLTTNGEVELAQATYLCEIDGTGADRIRQEHLDKGIILGGADDASELVLTAIGKVSPDCPDFVKMKILEIDPASAGGLEGDFQTKPAKGDYLGYGVFMDSYQYQEGVTLSDYELTVFQALEGDTDGDADVDPSDLAKLVQNWAPAGTDKAWPQGNFDDYQDGNVDPSDLSILVQNWAPAGYDLCAEGAPPVGGSAAVPEPGTLVMLAVGLLGLLWWRHRRRVA